MKKCVPGEELLKKELAKWLVKCREDRGLFQVDLASKLDISPQALSCYERGSHYISLPRLMQIVELFNIPLEKFFRDLIRIKRKIDKDL